jgi:hypothetical protein
MLFHRPSLTSCTLKHDCIALPFQYREAAQTVSIKPGTCMTHNSLPSACSKTKTDLACVLYSRSTAADSEQLPAVHPDHTSNKNNCDDDPAGPQAMCATGRLGPQRCSLLAATLQRIGAAVPKELLHAAQGRQHM